MRIRELFLTIAVLLAAFWPLSGQRPTSRRLPVDLEAIVDVDGDAAGRVYLIENRRNRLLVLDSTFAIVAEVANVLSDSTAVVMEQRAVRVLDRKRFVRVERYLRRLDVFEWRGGQVAKVLATRFPFEVEDACPVGGDTLVLVGLHKGMRLHTVLLDGTLIGAFAPVDTTQPKWRQRRFASGWVACSTDLNKVAFTPSLDPHVEVFERLTGQRVFRAGFPLSHRAQTLTYDEATGIGTIASGPSGVHVRKRPSFASDTLEVPSRLNALGKWKDTVLVHRYLAASGRYLGTRVERALRFELRNNLRLTVTTDEAELASLAAAWKAPSGDRK